MEVLLVNYFDPLTRRIKLMTLDWALKNSEEFIEKVLGKPDLKEPLLRMEVEEVLRSEVIFTVMQLCEDLLYVFETYKYTSADPVATFKTILKAPQILSGIERKEAGDLLDWLSWPPKLAAGQDPLVTDGLKQFRDFLGRVRKFYFKHLQLYNCYKHGHRLAYIISFGTDNEPYPTMLYFPPEEDRYLAEVIRVEDVGVELKLADDILEVASVAKENWLTRRRDEASGQFTLSLPLRGRS